jgi:hypothetical protein
MPEEAGRPDMTEPSPPDGDRSALPAALCQTETFVRHYVVLSPHESTAVALWVAHIHAFAAAYATPYLSISSAEIASGKTRLLEPIRIVTFEVA